MCACVYVCLCVCVPMCMCACVYLLRGEKSADLVADQEALAALVVSQEGLQASQRLGSHLLQQLPSRLHLKEESRPPP